MSDFTGSEDEFDDQPSPGDLRKQVERHEQKAREADARAAALERELAFAKAGLDLNDPKMGYFVKGYDGEADPEKIRAAAEAAGFLAPPAPAVPPGELAQHQIAANLAAGATAGDVFTGVYSENPQYQSEIRMARSPDEVLAKVRAYGGIVQDDLDY